MVSMRIPEKLSVALLSVTGGDVSAAHASTDKPNTALAGGSLVDYQIKTLFRAGISRFLVEVENMDGAMLALADQWRQKNVLVDFVRTGADIQRYLKLDDRIWVQSGQLYVQPDFVETLSKSPDNFVATVDGRDENSLFERIDLNTRWAGISIVGASTIATLKDLPEDWSIISSLLRQAILAKVPLRLLSQQHVNNGTLNIVQGPQDFVQLNKQILRRRVLSQPGFVEARVLGPVSAKLVPIIWQSPIALKLVKFAAPVFALGAVALGVEYRKDRYRFEPSPQDLAGEYGPGSQSRLRGEFDVKEVFGEIRIPIFSDRPLLETVAIEGAARYSDYGGDNGTVGGVFTWKVGGEYAPFDWMRFRSAYNRAIRAPTLNELRSPITLGFSSGTDPCTTSARPSAAQKALCVTQGIAAGDNASAFAHRVSDVLLHLGHGFFVNQRAGGDAIFQAVTDL